MSTLLLLGVLAACSGPDVAADATPAPDAAPATPPPDAPDQEATAPLERLTIDTTDGPMTITPVYHATTLIQADGKTIWLDPWSKAKLDGRPQADVVLLTDTHPDHLDVEALAKVSKPETVLVAPRAVADALGDREVDHVLANGQEVALGQLTVKAVPMYNELRGPDGGGVFHEKGRGNGYLLTLGDTTVYFAGDTECTAEMRALTGVDVAFIPMNLPYTMPPAEAAACVKVFRPARVVPYHHAGSDVGAFVQALEGSGIEPVLLDFYPGGEPR